MALLDLPLTWSSPGWRAAGWVGYGTAIAGELRLSVRDLRAGLRRVPASDRRSGLLIALTTAASLIAAVAVAARVPALRLPAEAAVTTAGLALLLCGVVLRQWAVVSLGRFFRLVVTVQAGHTVVDTGPYAYVRHPAYSGALLTMLGLGLSFDSIGSVVMMSVPLVAVMYRIDVEEHELTARLGDAYASYCTRTRRLIPGIW